VVIPGVAWLLAILLIRALHFKHLPLSADRPTTLSGKEFMMLTILFNAELDHRASGVLGLKGFTFFPISGCRMHFTGQLGRNGWG